MNALEKAVKAAGTAEKLGEMLGISKQAVSQWKTKGNGIIPSDRVIPIFHATGVTPHEQRPDLYPTPDYGLLSKCGDEPCNSH